MRDVLIALGLTLSLGLARADDPARVFTREGEAVGDSWSCDVDGMPLADVVAALARDTGASVVWPTDLLRTLELPVSLRLREVTASAALQAACRVHGFQTLVEGKVLVVDVPRDRLLALMRLEAERASAAAALARARASTREATTPAPAPGAGPEAVDAPDEVPDPKDAGKAGHFFVTRGEARIAAGHVDAGLIDLGLAALVLQRHAVDLELLLRDRPDVRSRLVALEPEVARRSPVTALLRGLAVTHTPGVSVADLEAAHVDLSSLLAAKPLCTVARAARAATAASLAARTEDGARERWLDRATKDAQHCWAQWDQGYAYVARLRVESVRLAAAPEDQREQARKDLAQALRGALGERADRRWLSGDPWLAPHLRDDPDLKALLAP